MSDEKRLQEIRERAEKATKGPWFWSMSLKTKSLALESVTGGMEIVMDFVRWGMGSAIARFRRGDIMESAADFGVQVKGREHHASWFQTLAHPDAEFIAHSREDIPWLLSALLSEREKALLECAGMMCEFCRDGDTPTKTKDDFGRNEIFVHNVEVGGCSWWACQAEAIRAKLEGEGTGNV